jgi:hypothetical protein
MTIIVDHLHNHASYVLLAAYLSKLMHHTTSQENEAVTKLEELEGVVVQEATKMKE